MDSNGKQTPRKVLIASGNPLFGLGLQKMVQEHWGSRAIIIGMTGSLEETARALAELAPDVVIVDYDDRKINREAFLNHFVSGKNPMQVMLVSLQEAGAIVVYDRRTLTPDQFEEWLGLPWLTSVAPHPVQPPPPTRRNSMRHFVIAGVLVVVLTFVTSLVLTAGNLLPVEASAQATVIDRLFNMHFVLISFLFSLIVVFMGYSLVVFRHRKGDNTPAAQIHGSTGLEILWTVLPLAAVLYFAFYGSQALAQVRQEAPNALLVKVTAGQWYWSFEYPEFGVTSTELVLPVNRQVLLQLSSRDVIHSFWVPEFRVKQDVLPGENLVKELRITPSREGNFTLMCAELCGGAHAYMNAKVSVMGRDAFDQWMAGQVSAVLADPVARGEKWATQNGCLSCHSVDGKAGVGPTWKGLFGHEVELADGTRVTADEEYLRESILNPAYQVVVGFSGNVMPANYGDKFTEEQVQDLIAFIKTLK